MNCIFHADGVGWHNINYPEFSIEEGEFVFITGPSGCGKSTLLRLLNGVRSVERGVLLYRDKDVSLWNPLELRRQVLLAGQSVYLEIGSLADNFAKIYAYRDLPCPSEAVMREYSDICCVSCSLNASCEQLSVGERQRVYLAVVISFASPVILLDEPTSALDRGTGERFMKQLRGHCKRQDRTAVIVTHDNYFAEQYADKIIALQ